MEVQGSSESYNEADVQALVVPVFQGEKTEDGLLKELDKAADGTPHYRVTRTLQAGGDCAERKAQH